MQRARTSARWLRSARITGSTASPLENCPPYFYHITSFLSHLPLLGLIAIIVQPPPSLVFPASLRFSAILFLLLFLCILSSSFVRVLPSIPLPSHHSPSSSVSSFSRLLGRPASGSPQRRDLRHFTCVSFASDPVLLSFLSFFAIIAPSRHPFLPSHRQYTLASTLFRYSAVILSSFPRKLLVSVPPISVRNHIGYRSIMTVTGLCLSGILVRIDGRVYSRRSRDEYNRRRDQLEPVARKMRL